MDHWNVPGWVSTQCTPNSWEPWGSRYQCAVWLSNWVHRTHGICFCVFMFFWINLYVLYQLKPALWTGRARWNMDLATHKSVVQLASTGSPNREENYLHAWWHWSVYKSCRTDWEPTTPNCDGSRLGCSHGFIVVGILSYLISVLVSKPIKMGTRSIRFLLSLVILRTWFLRSFYVAKSPKYESSL